MGIDLPGHGRSQPPGRSSIDDYADDVAALLKQQKFKQAILIGHSMGGAIAQTLALNHPEIVAGLVLIGTGARLPVSDLILEKTVTDFAVVTHFVTQYSWSPDAPAPLKQKAHDVLVQTPPDVLHSDFMACNAFNMIDQLGKIDVPLCVIADTNSERIHT